MIFTTAFYGFAVDAIRFSAFNYLLKPVDTEELTGTFHRCHTSHIVNKNFVAYIDYQGMTDLKSGIKLSVFKRVLLPECRSTAVRCRRHVIGVANR